MKKKFVSRRRFVTLSSFGLASAYTAWSDQLVPRLLRGFIAETQRRILPSHATPVPHDWDSDGLTAAWLGHSTVLLNFGGVTILTDPALGNRIGANTVCGTVGPKRLVAPALKPHQLPPIDLVLLSHAHMDHLDFPTLRRLPAGSRAVTARNTGDLVRQAGWRRPVELGWGDKTRITTRHGDVEIEAFEVNHWGARWKVDRRRGYNGYIISRGGRKIIFGGDTALTTSFRSLRSKGPFDLAIMPIGAYNPWIYAHCTPEQAVDMANGAGATYFLPIHFKTFQFGREGASEPIQRLHAAIDSERIGWSDIGQTFCLN